MFNLTDLIFKTFLFFSNEACIILILTIGFLVLECALFGKILFLVLTSIILNVFLKDLWQNPALTFPKDRLNFPSGHMQAAMCFWGGLCFHYKNKIFRSLVLFLLTGIAFGLYHFNYHHWIDILGGMFFGASILMIYAVLNHLPTIQRHIPFLGSLIIILSLPILYFLPKIPPQIMTAEGGLLGFSLGWSLLEFYGLENHYQKLRDKLLILTITFLGIALILFGYRYLSINPLLLSFLRTFLISFWVSFGSSLVVKGLKKI